MYRGLTAKIQCGRGGFVAIGNQTAIGPENYILLRNCNDLDYLLRKVPGEERFDQVAVTGAPTVCQGHDWQATPSVQRMVTAWADGTIYKEVGGNVDSVTLASGLGANKMVVFVEGGLEATGNARKLFFFNGNNVVQVLSADGAVTTNLATPPADWAGTNQPTGGLIHSGRLVGFGNVNFPHGLYISTAANHETFTGADTFLINVFPGYGERIVAAISFLGRIYVFKYPTGIFWVDTTSLSAPIVKLVKTDIGMASPDAIARVGDDVLFQSSVGTVHSLTAVNTAEDTGESDITARFGMQQWVLDNIKQTRLDRARMYYSKADNEVLLAFTSKAGTINDTLLRFSTRETENLKVYIDDKSSHREALWLRKETDGTFKSYGAGTGGLVFKLFSQNRNVDGTAFTAQFQTPHDDFKWLNEELEGMEKRFDWLELVAKNVANSTLQIDIYLDGAFYKTLYFTVGTGNAAFGSAVFGTSVFGGGAIFTTKQRMAGRGVRLSLVGTNTGVNADFALAEMLVNFKPSRRLGSH